MRRPQLIPCEPPLWAQGGHAQTILGHLLPSPRLEARAERHEVSLPDGDRLVVRYFPGGADLVTYLFHGLGGEASADYMERTARLCRQLGHSVYLANHRGCGEGRAVARRPYHSGRGEDLARVIEYGRRRHPGRRHLAIGFSLSGNALLCLLSGLRGDVPPDYAITVNAPIDLQAASAALGQGFNRVYDFRFVHHLRRAIRMQVELGLVSKSHTFPWTMTLREFDSLFTAPRSGFASREEYYDSCSTHTHLHKIRIPTILLTSEDDPFVPCHAYRQARLSPTTCLHIEKTGGHMGYLTRRKTPLGSLRWLDYALRECTRTLTAG